MEDNAAEDDDIDFSIINPDNDKHKALNFSVNQLLENPKKQENKQSSIQPQQQEPQCDQPQGSFLRDLGKLEQQISYETNPYDIYEPSQQPGQFTGTGQGKQQDTCTKTINNLTRACEKFVENDFKHLILDFTDQKGASNLKTKQSFQDYFQGSILKTKKIAIKISEKLSQTKTKSTAELISKRSTSKNKNKLTNYSKRNSTSKSNQKKIQSNASKKSIENDKINKQRKESKRSSSSKSKMSIKSKEKYIPSQIHKQTKNRQQSQIYSEYYGFDEARKQTKKKKSVSKSKEKIIIFSKKNVNACH